jgi:aspartate--ammonia ligase
MTEKLLIPANYKPVIDLMETEIAIKKIKDFFQVDLAKKLQLTRVSAPLFVDPTTGLNDNLNGVERTVDFTLLDMAERRMEIVQSLAKWKRMALGKYGFKTGTGLYTDMNALRRDEELDNLHSIYVDQWDWEKAIDKTDRTVDYLKATVRSIYSTIKDLSDFVNEAYPELKTELPDEIFFITTQELENLYPEKTPKERENAITKEKRAVFIQNIGHLLESGIKHDGRAPDYDDWNLNGDIVLWSDILNIAFELSSMGIRVDEETMESQLEIAGALGRKKMDFHKKVLQKELPYSIGGGIGQSRLCMYFLRKAHIGEVQVAIWPENMIEECSKNNIFLL